MHGFYIEVTHANVAEDPRRLPPPADAEERRALHHAGAEGVRGQGAVGAGPLAGPRKAALRARSSTTSLPAIPTLQTVARALATLDVLAEVRRARRSARLARPEFAADDRTRDPRRPPPGGRASRSRPSSPTTSPAARPPAAVDHRPEHGRQVDLHAPGRGDRAARVLRLVRAGATAACIGPLDASTPASAPPTTSPAAARRSWSR